MEIHAYDTFTEEANILYTFHYFPDGRTVKLYRREEYLTTTGSTMKSTMMLRDMMMDSNVLLERGKKDAHCLIPTTGLAYVEIRALKGGSDESSSTSS